MSDEQWQSEHVTVNTYAGPMAGPGSCRHWVQITARDADGAIRWVQMHASEFRDMLRAFTAGDGLPRWPEGLTAHECTRDTPTAR